MGSGEEWANEGPGCFGHVAAAVGVLLLVVGLVVRRG